jgi:hypothetical protein
VSSPSPGTSAGATPARRTTNMTDIERQRLVIMATAVIAAVVWAIANLA